MIINIIGGSGVMGTIHKKVLEEASHEVIISGRNTTPSIEEAAKNSDISIISVPIDVTEEIIKRVAPLCTAIMDFTGLKVFPIKTMLESSNKDCEVGGLHPLYGKVKSINGETVIFCKTEKSGERCQEIVNCLKNAGAKIKEMSPEEHDLIVGGISQNARLLLLENYAKLLKKHNLKVKDFYEISSPPTRIILSLLARQVSESNDELYDQMKNHNPKTEELKKILKNNLDEEISGKEIRELFGDNLEEFQNKAKKLIEKFY